MKILILHQYFKSPATGGAIRSYYLASALVEAGHHAIVITGCNDKKYKVENVEGIEVHYLPIAYDNRFQFYARGWAFLKYLFGVTALSGKFRGVDLCYAISVPLTVGLAARWIKFRHKIPYIFEVGDLWPDAPIQMGFVQNYFLRQLLYSMEKSNYQSSKSIVALSPAIQSAIRKKAPGKTVHVIPNMADCDFFAPETKNPKLEEKFDMKGKFVVAYIGAIGVANGLDYFLECANISRKANLPVHFIICGDGALLDRLKGNAEQLGLTSKVSDTLKVSDSSVSRWLSFIPFTNRDGVREVMNVTDAVFVCYKNVSILETGSPNKYFDGLAAGKLIVINFSGWIRKEIEEAKCGVYVDPQHPTDFVKKLSPFLADREMLKQYQNASRNLAEKKYSRGQLGKEWASIVANHNS